MPRRFFVSGETGCQATKIDVELVLCPVMLVGATRGTEKKRNIHVYIDGQVELVIGVMQCTLTINSRFTVL